MSKKNEINENDQKLSIFQVIISSLAAMIGIQSQAIRERDFTKGTVIQFVIVGVVFTVLFVLALIFIVGLVLK